MNDMQFVYETLAAKYNENHMIVYGRSLGSGFATKIASDNKPRYLILDAPYFSFKKAIERFLPFLPVRYAPPRHFPPISGRGAGTCTQVGVFGR